MPFFRSMDPIVAKIREDLKASVDEKSKQSFQRFFKEQITFYGVKTDTVGKIAKKHWNEVKLLEKKEIFRLCEELYRSGITEEAFIVSSWLPNLVDKFDRADLTLLRT